MNPKLILFQILLLIFISVSCKKEVNNPPVISDQTFEIPEKIANGTIVGTVIASDPNFDKLNFELINKSSVELPFYIESTTGNIIVKNGKAIDYEITSKYIVSVVVTEMNNEALFCSGNITINVKNIDDLPLNGMIAYYPFNGNSLDEGTNLFDGNLFGATAYNDRKSRSNGALYFDGINDYVLLNPMVGNEIRSISLWFRLEKDVDQNIGSVVPLLARDGDPQNVSEFNFGFIPLGWAGNAGRLRFIYNYIKDSYYYVQSNNSFWRKGEWHHVVIVISPTEGMKMFIDNVLQNEIVNYYSGIASGGKNMSLYVGSFEPQVGRFFWGEVDDLIFYNRPLNESEIGEIFRL